MLTSRLDACETACPLCGTPRPRTSPRSTRGPRSAVASLRVFGLRTDNRIVQQPDERINLMILESLDELSPSIGQLLHTIRAAAVNPASGLRPTADVLADSLGDGGVDALSAGLGDPAQVQRQLSRQAQRQQRVEA